MPKESKYFKDPSGELECIFPCTVRSMVSIYKYVNLYKATKVLSILTSKNNKQQVGFSKAPEAEVSQSTPGSVYYHGTWC